MRQCIFCMNFKEDENFNKEHIILDSLGGLGINDIFFNVCEDCNSKLGHKVDSMFSGDEVTKIYRYMLKIEGKKGMQNPFKKMHIGYDNTPITGSIVMNKKGDLTGFKADCKVYEDLIENYTLLVAPRKNICGYVNSYLKRKGLKELSEEEILKNKFEICNPKMPNLESVEISKEYQKVYLNRAYPLMLKMAYEFCYIRLGTEYLHDKIAKDIRECINQLLINNTEMINPTQGEIEYTGVLEKKSSISFESAEERNILYVNISLLGVIKARILVSESYHKYDLTNSDPIIVYI